MKQTRALKQPSSCSAPEVLRMDPRRQRWTLGVLLLFSGLALSSLVPGGPIENRDFSHIAPGLLLLFNVLLTALGLGSLLLSVMILRGVARAPILVFGAAVAYLVVYTADLLGWFPPTPSPMSRGLVAIEMLGIALAIPMLWLTAQGLEDEARVPLSVVFHPAVVTALGVLAMSVILFSTLAAMGR